MAYLIKALAKALVMPDLLNMVFSSEKVYRLIGLIDFTKLKFTLRLELSAKNIYRKSTDFKER